MKTLFLVLFLASTQVSFAEEVQETLPSVLCDVIGHPVYKNTIVFGSGNRELFLIEEDRDKNHLYYDGFELSLTDEGYFAVDKNNGEVLFSITSDEESFVKIAEPESKKYKILNCIQISG